MIPGTADIAEKKDPMSETMSDAKMALRTPSMSADIMTTDVLVKLACTAECMGGGSAEGVSVTSPELPSQTARPNRVTIMYALAAAVE